MIGQNITVVTPAPLRLSPNMNRRIVSGVTVGILSAVVSPLWALGLGNLKVNSAVGQPLNAQIELTLASNEPIDSVRVKVASPAKYAQNKVDYASALQRISVTPKMVNNLPVIAVTSDGSVQESNLNLLLEANTNSAWVVRDYVLLLDPAAIAGAAPSSVTNNVPNAASNTVQTPIGTRPIVSPVVSANVGNYWARSGAQPQLISSIQAPVQGQFQEPTPTVLATDVRNYPQTVATTASVDNSRTVAVPFPVSKINLRGAEPEPSGSSPAAIFIDSSAGAASYTVQRGDTLSSIALNAMQPGVSLEQMLIALQRANADAFINGNINSLRSNVQLAIPNATAAQAVEQSEALKEVKLQTENWQGYQARVADKVPLVRGSQGSSKIAGKVTTSTAVASATGAKSDRLQVSPGDKTGATKEDRVAQNKTLVDSKSRQKDLEKSVTDLKSAVKLKNETPVDTAKASAKDAAAKDSVAKSNTTPTATPASSTTAVSAPSVAAAEASTTEKSEPSFFSFLRDNAWLPALLGLGLAGLGAYVWSRRRKHTIDDEPTLVKSAIVDTQESPHPQYDYAHGEEVLSTPVNSDPHPSQFNRAGPGSVHTGEVDAVAEAEVYIAYGRESQAEEILLEALKTDPNRAELHLKLLEVYGLMDKRAAFDHQMAYLSSHSKANPGVWAKTVSITQRFYADHPLLALSSPPSLPLGTGVASPVAGVGTVATSVAPPTTNTVTTVAASVAAGVGAAVATSAAAVASTAKAVAAPVVNAAQNVFDSKPTVEHPMQAAPESSSGLGNPPHPASPMAISANANANLVTTPPTKTGLEKDLADLEVGLAKAFDRKPSATSALDSSEMVNAVAPNHATYAAATTAAMPTPQPYVQANRLETRYADASTRLELAQAYSDMGDHAGAREILQEVLRDGNDMQKRSAQLLFDKLRNA